MPTLSAPQSPATGEPPTPPPSAPRRITVVASGARADLALPGRCTIAELLPALVRALGVTGDTAGWALHRPAGPALPAGRTVAAIGLRDGEVLHLLPTGWPRPELVYDDLIDAVAGTVSAAPGRWGPAWSRRIALGVAVATAACATPAAATAVPFGSLVAAVTAVGLLAAGVLLARRGSAAVGAALAAAGIPGLMAAVLTGPAWPGSAASPRAFAAGCAAVTGYALVAGALLSAYRVWFVAAASTAAAGAVAAAVVFAGDFAAASGAAVLLVLAVLASPAYPALALRLGALAVPDVPADMAGFRTADLPTPAGEVAGRTRTAEAALTALLTAATLVVVLAGGLLVTGEPAAGWLLAALGGLALVIRSRAYAAVGQRVVLLAGGAILLPSAAVVAAYSGVLPAPVFGAAALITGVAGTAHAVRGGRRAPSAYWGRLLDIVDFVAVTALVPAAAAVLGLYGSAHALTG